MRLIWFVAPLLLVSTLNAQSPEFTSSDVADAAERLTGRRAHMTKEMKLLAGTGLAGPAITLRVVRDEEASLIEEGLAAIRVIESAPAGSVVVVTLDDEKSFAVFGATFATLAKSRRLAGFVVDGSVRGLPELRRLAFPTFARGTVPGSAGGHYRLDAINVPVMCGGIEVSPGDYVVADEDGVAVVPQERYQEALAKAKELRREKQTLLPLIEKYRSYTEAVQERNKAVMKPGNAKPQP
jgi:regulator of RNase E activity RraA